MNCAEAEVYVSALNDGEPVPKAAANHISGCAECQQTLRAFSAIGAQLRLAAAHQASDLRPLPLSRRNPFLSFLSVRVGVPRFALAGLIVCATLAVAAASLLRAQSPQLWFQYALGFDPQRGSGLYTVAQNGFDEEGALFGSSGGAAVHIRVENVTPEGVTLRLRAVPATIEQQPARHISLGAAHLLHYKPGEVLPIPVDGGGTLFLKGEVSDRQPKIAFGTPLEPASDKLDIRFPILISSKKLIANIDAASAEAYAGQAVQLEGSFGDFVFALQPFPGAVKAKAEWGRIAFSLEGEPYVLIAAAPLTGGDQPRTIWVRHDTASHCPAGWCIGSEPIPH